MGFGGPATLSRIGGGLVGGFRDISQLSSPGRGGGTSSVSEWLKLFSFVFSIDGGGGGVLLVLLVLLVTFGLTMTLAIASFRAPLGSI